MRDTKRSIMINPVRRTLYKSKRLSDCTLVVESIELPAHALVLGEASPYFERIWDSDMIEGKTMRVNIDGVSLQVMDIILQYMYGCLEDIPTEIVSSVLKAADRFQVGGQAHRFFPVVSATYGRASLRDSICAHADSRAQARVFEFDDDRFEMLKPFGVLASWSYVWLSTNDKCMLSTCC